MDAKSEELWNEFLEHERQCQEKNPEMTDRTKIMQGWMLQKIAGLHCVVLDLVARVSELEFDSKIGRLKTCTAVARKKQNATPKGGQFL